MTPDQPDPTVLEKLYHSGAWVPLGILLAFFGLRAAKSRIAWLQEDHRAVWVSAILGGLATLIVPATQGTTPNLAMIIGAVVTVASLHADPKKTPAEQKQAQAGFIQLGLMVVIAMLGAMLLFGCSPSSRTKALDATFAGLSAAQVGYGAWEKQHEIDIGHGATGATSNADGEAKLKEFRIARDKVSADFVFAFKALSSAFDLNDDTSLANALAAAKLVQTELVALGFKL